MEAGPSWKGGHKYILCVSRGRRPPWRLSERDLIHQRLSDWEGVPSQNREGTKNVLCTRRPRRASLYPQKGSRGGTGEVVCVYRYLRDIGTCVKGGGGGGELGLHRPLPTKLLVGDLTPSVDTRPEHWGHEVLLEQRSASTREEKSFACGELPGCWGDPAFVLGSAR